MQLFYVVDTLGGGRIVGIFSTRETAAEIAAIEPHYYRLESARVDEINPAALQWARTEPQRDQLRRLMRG